MLFQDDVLVGHLDPLFVAIHKWTSLAFCSGRSIWLHRITHPDRSVSTMLFRILRQYLNI